MGVLDRAAAARAAAENSTAKVSATLSDLEKAQRDAERRREANDLLLVSAQQVPDSILTQWIAEETALRKTEEARRVTWEVVKPAAVQPGAPNEFLLVVRDRERVPTGNVVAEVRDQTDAVIHSQPIDYEKKRDHTTVRLPASVWSKLTPQSELFLTVAQVDDKSDKKTELQEKVRLLGPVYATVLTTDKPVYRPGETVYFRSLTLDRSSFAPPPREQLFRYELVGPSGHPVRAGVTGGTELARAGAGKVETILGPDGKPLRGVGAGAIAVPADAADGDYTLVLRELPHAAGYPPAVPFPVARPVKVRSGAAEAYHKRTTFRGAAAYFAGDTVEAEAELKLRDEPVAGAEVQAVATADNVRLDVFADQPATGPDGKARLRFRLPTALERGDVRLMVTFKTKSGEETVAERVPVVGRNVVVEFFPEGGNLVAGVPCRVYFRATTPGGVPVDVAGVVTDGRRTLAEVRTVTGDEPGENRGIGSFTFTPELGTPVWLKLTSPAGATSPLAAPASVAGAAAAVSTRTGFFLPKVEQQGVVMTVPNPVTAPGEPVRVQLRSVAKTRNLVVGAYTRGRLSDTQTVTAEPGKLTEVRLMAGTDPRGGVVRVTVFEELPERPGQPKPDHKPVAERLVFRKPGEILNLDFATSGTRAAGGAGFVPGTPVDLTVTATTDRERKTPAAAVLYAAVVNTAAAPGPKDRLLTTHFLIAGEVNNPDAMEYADFLLSDHPKADEALDLVLATQGWRRFAEQTAAGYARRPVAPSADCANLLVYNGQYTTVAEPPSANQQRQLFDAYWPQYVKAAERLDEVRRKIKADQDDRSDEDRVRQLAAATEAARGEALAQAARAEAAAEPVARFRGAGWYAVAGFGLLALLLGAASLTRPTGRLPLGIGTVGSLGLVAFLVFALGAADRTQAAVRADEAAALPRPESQPEAGVPELGPPPRPGNLVGERPADQDALPDTNRRDNPTRGKSDWRGFPPGGFHGFGVPPKIGLPKADPKGGMALLPGGGGFAGFGGPETLPAGGGTPPAHPGAAPFPYRAGETYFQLPNPWFPGLPQQFPPVKLAAPTTGGAPPAGPPAGDLTHGYHTAGGWQVRKPVPDDIVRERAVLDLLARDNAKDVRAVAAPAPGVNGVGTSLIRPKFPGVPDPKPAPPVARAENPENEVYLEALAKARWGIESRARSVRQQLDADIRTSIRELDAAAGVQAQGTGRMLHRLPPDVLALMRVRDAVQPVRPLIVREYAAPRPGSGDKADGVESDTVLWQPVIVLPADGKTTLTFHVGNAEGGYQVIVAGHTLDGRIGAVRGIVPVAPAAGPDVTSPAPAGGVPPVVPPAPIKQ
jgi:hypothetical protein